MIMHQGTWKHFDLVLSKVVEKCWNSQ